MVINLNQHRPRPPRSFASAVLFRIGRVVLRELPLGIAISLLAALTFGRLSFETAQVFSSASLYALYPLIDLFFKFTAYVIFMMGVMRLVSVIRGAPMTIGEIFQFSCQGSRAKYYFGSCLITLIFISVVTFLFTLLFEALHFTALLSNLGGSLVAIAMFAVVSTAPLVTALEGELPMRAPQVTLDRARPVFLPSFLMMLVAAVSMLIVTILLFQISPDTTQGAELGSATVDGALPLELSASGILEAVAVAIISLQLGAVWQGIASATLLAYALMLLTAAFYVVRREGSHR